MEDYKKKYEGALKRAKGFKTDEYKDVAEYIFPELAKSEDVMIKEKIIATIHLYYGEPLEDEAKEMIAWLEKQGENSVCKVKIGETYKCIASPRYTCFRKGDTYHVEDNFVAELINICSGCFVLLEKQGEQKAKYHDVCDKCVRQPTCQSDCFLQQDEQKPWTEDDEKQARQIERIVHNDGCTQKLQKQIADWLESLKGRVQQQHKQEWSQNDIDMIDWLIRCCEKEYEELCNDKYGHQDIVSDLKRDCRKKWNWLESLKNKVVHQSTWKPSNEQMKALNEAIYHVDDSVATQIAMLIGELSKL